MDNKPLNHSKIGNKPLNVTKIDTKPLSHTKTDHRKELLEALEQNRKEFAAILAELEREIAKAPEGRLSIKRRGKYVHYYKLKKGDDHHGTYLKKEEADLAVALAQKSYDLQIVKLLRQEMKMMESFDQKSLFEKMDAVYTGMSRERRKLVVPIRLPDREFAAAWEAEEYEKGSFTAEDDTDFFTDRGERVRSKSEILIANYLYKLNVPYRYECKLVLSNGKPVWPDFTILNVRERKVYLWEHLGMMDRYDYREKTMRKMNDYIGDGIFPGEKLILTTETSQTPLKTWVIETMIKKYCK